MKIAVGCFHQESNTFTPLRTDLDDFVLFAGSEAIRPLEQAHPALSLAHEQLSGILDVMRYGKAEVVPVIFANALPGGVMKRSAYERLKEITIDEITRAMPVDGVCLALHGSTYVEDIGHGESDLLASIRSVVGKDVPITCCLDIHGNITRVLASCADALVTYRTIPHEDAYETGGRAARILLRILETGKTLHMATKRLPILVPGEASETSTEPMKGLMELARTEESSKPGIVSCSIAMGDGGGDYYENGVCTIAISEDSFEVASAEAQFLAGEFWKRRNDFRFSREAYPVDRALDVALSAKERPVFLSDLGDDATGGGTTDSTFILERILNRNIQPVLLGPILDPVSFERCVERGVGSSVSLEIGGNLDHSSPPVRVECSVLKIPASKSSEKTEESEWIAAVLTKGVTILLSSKRIGITHPSQLTALGYSDLSVFRIIVLKMGYLFPELEKVAPRSILAISPGCADYVSEYARARYRKLKNILMPTVNDDSSLTFPE